MVIKPFGQNRNNNNKKKSRNKSRSHKYPCVAIWLHSGHSGYLHSQSLWILWSRSVGDRVFFGISIFQYFFFSLLLFKTLFTWVIENKVPPGSRTQINARCFWHTIFAQTGDPGNPNCEPANVQCVFACSLDFRVFCLRAASPSLVGRIWTCNSNGLWVYLFFSSLCRRRRLRLACHLFHGRTGFRRVINFPWHFCIFAGHRDDVCGGEDHENERDFFFGSHEWMIAVKC